MRTLLNQQGFTGSVGPMQTRLEASVSAILNHGHNLSLTSKITSMLTDCLIVLELSMLR